MSELKMGLGESDEWYTPPSIFDALALYFDLDPCSPGPGHWVPARRVYTKSDNGLMQPWQGIVWMNPPFGGRNGHVPWLKKFFQHGNGICLVRAYTSSGWFHDWAPKADAVLFPKGKTKFVRPDGSLGGSPSSGIVLMSKGENATNALVNSGIGLVYKLINEGAE